MTSALTPLHELEFETAAEHHTRRVPIAGPRDSAGEVWQSLRGKRFDSVAEIAILDDQGRLAGLVNIEDVLAASDETLLEAIMDSSPPAVMPGVDQEVAAWKAIHHGETSLPVVDDQQRFQGIITPRRIFEVLLWEHDEDTARLAGVLAGSTQARVASEEKLLARLWHRLPWLLVGLAGAVLSAELVGVFEAKLHAHLILAFFVPGIVYLADAIGTQTETLTIRGMSVGIRVERVFFRELMTGFFIGLILATIFFVLVLARWQRLDVAIAVSIALFAASSIASAVAMGLPWLLRGMGQDPAFAAGPLATVIQDLLSVLTYFVVCMALV